MQLGGTKVVSRLKMGFDNIHSTLLTTLYGVVSNFREVNKQLVRKPFQILKISSALQELDSFTYASVLDLNMGYYTIRLDPDASKICTIILPWGKHSYLRLPMGIACSPDIFQAKMSVLMVTLEFG